MKSRIIQLNDLLNEKSIGKATNNISIVMNVDVTHHARIRKSRDENKPITDDDIGKKIKLAIPKIANLLLFNIIDHEDEIAILSKSGLNIIGKINKSKSNELQFVVTTVMFNPRFRPTTGTEVVRIP